MSDAVRYVCLDCQRAFTTYEIEEEDSTEDDPKFWETKYCPYCGSQRIEAR